MIDTSGVWDYFLQLIKQWLYTTFMYIYVCCKYVKPKERLHIISLGPIGESLTSKSVHELSTKSVRKRCDWHILEGNEGRIVEHCLTRFKY